MREKPGRECHLLLWLKHAYERRAAGAKGQISMTLGNALRVLEAALKLAVFSWV